MPAKYYAMVCEQGATLSRTVTWKTKSGEFVDTTGYSARLQVRTSASSSTTVLNLTNEITIPSAGKIVIEVPAAATAALIPGAYVYDMLLTKTGAPTRRLLEGSFTVKAAVTR